jgi:hypothetical protein
VLAGGILASGADQAVSQEHASQSHLEPADRIQESFAKELHRKFQSDFEDLDPVLASHCGFTRVDYFSYHPSDILRAEPGKKIDPQHKRFPIHASDASLFAAFSRRGKSLQEGELELYFVVGGGSALAENNNKPPKLWGEIGKWAHESAKSLRDNPDGFAVRMFQDRSFEAHMIRLTKEECLPCHQGMKLGDPVAVMVYQRAKSAKAEVKN